VVYTNGELAAAPRTDPQWTRLREHAESLGNAARSLAALGPETNVDEWQRQSAALADASAAAGRAIEEKSLEGVLDAGGRMYGTCTACHAAYAARAD
jgi:hypothetical protein